jgi:hypothetical protein
MNEEGRSSIKKYILSGKAKVRNIRTFYWRSKEQKYSVETKVLRIETLDSLQRKEC